jgi:hypothetical protein
VRSMETLFFFGMNQLKNELKLIFKNDYSKLIPHNLSKMDVNDLTTLLVSTRTFNVFPTNSGTHGKVYKLSNQ